MKAIRRLTPCRLHRAATLLEQAPSPRPLEEQELASIEKLADGHQTGATPPELEQNLHTIGERARKAARRGRSDT